MKMIEGYWRGNPGRRSIGELFAEAQMWPGDPKAIVIVLEPGEEVEITIKRTPNEPEVVNNN